MSYMQVFLGDFIAAAVVTSTSGTSISACSFIVLTDRVIKLMLLWRLFSVFCSWDSYSRTSFHFESSRIALIITIRIATIKNPRCFYRCSDSFNTATFTNRKDPSPAPLCCSSPISASWQRIARRRWLQYFDERHSVISTRIVLFSIFRYLTHWCCSLLWSFGVLLPSFGSTQSYFIEHSTSCFFENSSGLWASFSNS